MKPFLKWAGNKYQIVKHIQAVLQGFPHSGRLIEPFAGSGAVFLSSHYTQALLSDINGDLIRLYQTLQAEGPEFVEYCQSWFTQENNTPEAYYPLREQFNTTTDERLKSALFVYLNRHCFNGLCRYNLQGGFNVPFGKYKKPYFPREEMLGFYEAAKRATFSHQDFETAMNEAQPGDVVYCDPPYVPLSQTANFTSYSKGGFRMTQQLKLAHLAQKLAERGVYVLISNHNTAFTQEAYKAACITELEVQRYISCQGDSRGKASEVLAMFAPKRSLGPVKQVARR